MHSEDSENGLFCCLSPVRALLGRRKRPQLSSNPSPLGQGGPSSSSMNSSINQTSGPSLDLSPLGQGGPSSSSMDSNSIMQSSPPSSHVSLLGRDGPTSIPMDSNSNQTSGPSSDLSPLGHEGIASTSSNSIRSFRYDVFISFRGSDTRNTFVDHLYAHLIRKGIFAFKDDIELRKGELISPQLVQAIQDSRVSIVVFSEDYASSSWCLDEMATIVDCHQQFKQSVFSVFYHVDPSHVRKQNGVYENAFILHNDKFKQDSGKLDRWKTAMTNLGNSNGWHVKNDMPESTIIAKIAQEVIKTLNHKFSCFEEDLVGIQSRVEELEKLLKLSSENDDFRVLGIYGMGGIGKTTHAAVLYDKISYRFDASCFIENVRKVYRDGGAIAVQKQILRQALDEQNLDTYSSFEISKIMINRLYNIKVLAVLDNIDQLEQLQQLFRNPKLLCEGSRIVITTRNEHILRVYGADEIHTVPLLNKNDAHQLFCKRAFKSEEQSSSCTELIPEVLKYAQGLPLAIKVIGSSLCTLDATEWIDALDRLENSPDKEIMDVLEMSVEGLQFEDKEIFLHIACFFKGERKDYVTRILDACALNPRIGIPSLVRKSLITIKNKEIHMHAMLQELGKKIVRHKCPDEPESWSRVWHDEDFCHLLTTQMEANKVKAIVLNEKDDVFECEVQGLSKLVHLKLLILHHKNFSGELEFLSRNLRFLLWHECPLPSLPLKFEPYFLVELNMPYSNIRQLWKSCKRLPCLKRMDMSNSKILIETPNFEGVPALERLDLTGCTSLCSLHPSIGSLSKLVFLSLRNCSNLVAINFGGLSNLCSLRVLNLSGCTKLENTPDFTGAFNLEYLDMDGCTSLSTVHESIEALSRLGFLSLKHCTSLFSIPSNINTMTSLITLDLYGCSKLGHIPLTHVTYKPSFSLESLVSMDLSFCNLYAIPAVVWKLRCLERLNLQGNKFRSLPSTISELSCLAYLNLSHCHEFKFLPFLPTESASKVGRHFTISSGSRDHRSGLYVFDCPKFEVFRSFKIELLWLARLLKEPRHFRCGFDIVFPYHRKDSYFEGNPLIKTWFDHIFRGDSIIRVVHCDVDENWIGFLFSVEFEAEYLSTISTSPYHSSSSPLPHPFYLSFETECVEQRFDMALKLELDKIHGSAHIWTIYISREHCHFIETGAHITFKACPGLVVTNWGLRRIVKKDIDVIERTVRDNYLYDVIRPPVPPSCNKEGLVIDNVEKSSSSSSGPKIQLPYNWLVTGEDEAENLEAKTKENNLSNIGL